MPESYTEVYVHLVWSTFERQPLLSESVKGKAYDLIALACRRRRLDPLAIGGTDDHIHLLVQIPATTPVSELAHAVKGATSHWLRSDLLQDGFAWQEGYSAFSVSRWDVPKIKRYIESQEERHREGSIKMALEPYSAG